MTFFFFFSLHCTVPPSVLSQVVVGARGGQCSQVIILGEGRRRRRRGIRNYVLPLASFLMIRSRSSSIQLVCGGISLSLLFRPSLKRLPTKGCYVCVCVWARNRFQGPHTEVRKRGFFPGHRCRFVCVISRNRKKRCEKAGRERERERKKTIEKI